MSLPLVKGKLASLVLLLKSEPIATVLTLLFQHLAQSLNESRVSVECKICV